MANIASLQSKAEQHHYAKAIHHIAIGDASLKCVKTCDII
jgi:hypothetical protein